MPGKKIIVFCSSLSCNASREVALARKEAQLSTCSCSKAAGKRGEEEQMNETPNAQLPTPNAERSEHSTLGVERSALDVGRFLWRILDFVVAGIFIFAGGSRQLSG